MSKKNGSKPLTKSEFVTQVVGRCGELSKRQVEEVLRAVSAVTQEQLAKRGPGITVIPGVVRLKTVEKPATPERQGRNPFTGQSITIKAKPASRAVRATPVKALKEAVQ